MKHVLLVIDDDKQMVSMISAICRQSLPEVHVITALAGEQGLQLAQSEKPGVVVLDVNLQDLNGFEVCRRLKADPATASIHILMMSGVLMDIANRINGIQGGADSYLCKPFEPSEFVVQIQAMFRWWEFEQSECTRLEEMVNQRTLALGTANEQLRREAAEHRQALEYLHQSEERFRQMAENIHEVFWIANADLNEMLYVSPAFEAIWGRSCQSLYDDPELWLNAIHPDDRERVHEAFFEHRRDSQKINAEYRIIRPDGSIRWISDNGCTIRNVLGAIYRLTGVAEDITERKRAEEELLRQNTFNLAVLNALTTNIAVVTPAGELIATNAAWEQFALEQAARTENLHLRSGNYLKACEQAALAGDVLAQQALEGIRHVLAGARERFDFEYPCDSPTAKRWFLMHVTLLGDGSGAVVVAHENITARKQAEESPR